MRVEHNGIGGLVQGRAGNARATAHGAGPAAVA
jgi:hypothetical protein